MSIPPFPFALLTLAAVYRSRHDARQAQLRSYRRAAAHHRGRRAARLAGQPDADDIATALDYLAEKWNADL